MKAHAKFRKYIRESMKDNDKNKFTNDLNRMMTLTVLKKDLEEIGRIVDESGLWDKEKKNVHSS